MSTYVDSLMNHGWRLGRSCHLYADTLEELHAMALRIGMRRSWFQDDPGFPHYDLTVARRARAVAAGALETTRRHIVEFRRRHLAEVEACSPFANQKPEA